MVFSDIKKIKSRVLKLKEARALATQGKWNFDDYYKNKDSEWSYRIKSKDTLARLAATDYDFDARFIALVANETNWLVDNLIKAVEVLEFYADNTNYRISDDGFNCRTKLEIESYDGQPIEKKAQALIESITKGCEFYPCNPDIFEASHEKVKA